MTALWIFLGLIVVAFLRLVLRIGVQVQGYGAGGSWWPMIAHGRRWEALPDAGRSTPLMWRRTNVNKDAAAAARRKEAEFAEFYRNEFSKLVGLVMMNSALEINQHDAAIAAQNAMVGAWKRWDIIINPKSWVYTAAIREARRLCRSNWRRKCWLIGTPQQFPGPEPQDIPIELPESAKSFRGLLDVLTPKQRDVFLLHMEGFSHKEISRMLKITEADARQSLRRARTKLKEELEKRKEDGDEHLSL